MPGGLEVLRFLRDSEAGLRELAAANPTTVAPNLLKIGDDVADHATKLKNELRTPRAGTPSPALDRQSDPTG